MHEGIADYLEIMRLAGVSQLKKVAKERVGTSPSVLEAAQERMSVRPTVEVSVPQPEKVRHATSVAAPVPPKPEHRRNDADLASLPKAEQLRYLAEEVARCTLCKELAESRTQTVFGVGNPDSSLVFLGEAPGMDEDKQGEPFVGRAGQLLTDIIVKGMQMRREDVYICNILRCRPPGNRNPMPDEAAHCREFLERTLEIIKPTFICCLGAIAAKNLLSSEKTIGALRGRVWDYNGIRVVCTYHPAYLLRNPAAKRDVWEDIKLLLREMG